MKKPELRDLAFDLVDPPPAPIRARMDTLELAELARSIAVVGIIEPLIVVPRGGRYEVVAGHRRYLAAAAAGLVKLPCVVFDERHTALDAVQLHENLYREDLNPVEEARRFETLLVTCGDDVDALAALVRQSRDYVETRLLLLSGDGEVRDALATRSISLAVARELNKVRDDAYRKMFLDSAVQGGATAKVVLGWRVRANAGMAAEEARAAGDSPRELASSTTPDPETIFRCFHCEGSENPHDLQLFYVHSACLSMMRRLIAVALMEKTK